MLIIIISLYPPKPNTMNLHGPVIVIEDDADDQEFLKQVFTNLKYPNELIFFTDGDRAVEFLNRSDVIPFLIISDINMPKTNGFDLRTKLRTDAALQVKCIPYIFFSTALSQRAVVEAYSMSVQGFFVKQTSIEELEKTISVIMEYWKRCAAPNNFIAVA